MFRLLQPTPYVPKAGPHTRVRMYHATAHSDESSRGCRPRQPYWQLWAPDILHCMPQSAERQISIVRESCILGRFLGIKYFTVLFYFNFLRQGFAIEPRIAPTSSASCLYLSSTPYCTMPGLKYFLSSFLPSSFTPFLPSSLSFLFPHIWFFFVWVYIYMNTVCTWCICK